MKTTNARPVSGQVTLAEIRRQRDRGWPDFHPEDYCHRCGIKNLSWATEATAWNPVMRPDGEAVARWDEIICPQCFAELFERRFGPTTFLLTPDPRTIGGHALSKGEIANRGGFEELLAFHRQPSRTFSDWHCGCGVRVAVDVASRPEAEYEHRFHVADAIRAHLAARAIPAAPVPPQIRDRIQATRTFQREKS